MSQFKLSHSELLELRRWNCPSIYNGWEAIAKRDRLEGSINKEPVIDYTPQMGPMVGYAVTVEYCAGSKKMSEENPDAYPKMFEYLASIPGPKVIFMKDLDAPNFTGSIVGEVTGNACRALDCVGAVVDGWIRDADEACYGGFKLVGRSLGVGHGYCCPLRFGNEIEVFGAKITPGMVVHADKYGFIAIPEEETEHLLESVKHLDSVECQNMISASREMIGKSATEIAEIYRKVFEAQKRAGTEFRKRILG